MGKTPDEDKGKAEGGHHDIGNHAHSCRGGTRGLRRRHQQGPSGIVAAGAPGYVDDFVAIGEMRGQEAIRAFFSELFAAFPDFEMTVDQIVADDSAAAVQWHAVGTFTGGPFQGILPTGHRVTIRGVDVMRITGGLIQHNTIYYDGAAFARQIGMLPAQRSYADRVLVSTFNAKTKLSQRYQEFRRSRRTASP